MKTKRYAAPVSEILVMTAQDVVTTSDIVNTWDEYITRTEYDRETQKTWEHTYPNPNYIPPQG